MQTVVEMEDTLVAPLQLHHHPQRKGEVLDDLFPVDAYFGTRASHKLVHFTHMFLS